MYEAILVGWKSHLPGRGRGQEGDYGGARPRTLPCTCHGSSGDLRACQLTPPHDLMAACARRWLREQGLTAGTRHRAQGQEGGKTERANNRAVPRGLRLEVPRASVCKLWLATPPSRLFPGPLQLPSPPQWTMDKGARASFFLPPQGSDSPFASFSTSLCSTSLAMNRMNCSKAWRVCWARD